MKRSLILQVSSALVAVMGHAAPNFDLATKATNDFAAELYRQLATGEQNVCVSPYSIETALAMTFAGADGETHTEMARVLHFSSNASIVATSFASLQHSLEEMSAKTTELVKKIQGIWRPERTDHVEYCQPTLCSKRLRFSPEFFIAGKTKLRRCF